MLQQYQLSMFEFAMSYRALPGFVNLPLSQENFRQNWKDFEKPVK
jgi:hypothetical protein